jgi:hypothetical protein
VIGATSEEGGEVSLCPGCGVRLLGSSEGSSSSHATTSPECQRLCHELSLYTLTRGDAFFIHQVAVDAYAAQHAGPASKPISVAFALIGLCLLLERAHTGKAVQRAHVRLGKKSKQWPSFSPPAHRGSCTVADVLRVAPGSERDTAILQWASSVWLAWEKDHPAVRTLIDHHDKGCEAPR